MLISCAIKDRTPNSLIMFYRLCAERSMNILLFVSFCLLKVLPAERLFSMHVQNYQTLRTFIGVTIVRCEGECIMRKGCQGAIYHRRHKVCTLISSDLQNQTVTVNEGTVLLRDLKVSQESNWTCGGVVCSPTETCVQDGTICQVTECGQPPIPSSCVTGNLYAVNNTIKDGLSGGRFICGPNSTWLPEGGGTSVPACAITTLTPPSTTSTSTTPISTTQTSTTPSTSTGITGFQQSGGSSTTQIGGTSTPSATGAANLTNGGSSTQQTGGTSLQPYGGTVTSTPAATTTALPIYDCNDVTGPSGVYTLTVSGYTVYCDMVTDGGGWTVFQRRQDGSVDFYLGYSEYEAGFGDLNGEFWLESPSDERSDVPVMCRQQRGLEPVHEIFESGPHTYQLRVDMEDYYGDQRYASYNYFYIASALTEYRLDVDDYTGTAGDSLAFHNGMKFSTHDNDNDLRSYNCAERYRGAWWFNACHKSNLNGEYFNGGGNTGSYSSHIIWSHYLGFNRSLKKTEMKFRPV